ncbi:MAG: hypothetical protein P8J93_06470 [SAR86 cluster bacterium]|nr:hypothetical protein [SAR86 cluster bacterium]
MITTNASNAIPVPNNPVITMSLPKPNILDIKVQKLTRPLLTNSRIDVLSLETFAGSGFSLLLLLFLD